MALNNFLILERVPVLHRHLRRAGAQERGARAHEHRAHAQRGEHQPRRVLRVPPRAVAGQVFALFVITIAAAEVGIGLAIVLLIYRNAHSVDLDEADQLKG